MRLAPALVLIAACEPPLEDHPISPGGGGVGSSLRIDAAVVDPDGGTTIKSRVCLLSDPRAPIACSTTGASGLLVTLGNATATTADDGTFTLMRPTSTTGLYWSITGTGIVPSAMKFGAPALPALGTLLYEDMIISMQAADEIGQGAIIMRVTRASVGVTGAVVTAQPLPDSEIYYDGASALDWDTDATGNFGVMWIPSIITGTASLTIDEQNIVSGVSVFADTITFVFAEIP